MDEIGDAVLADQLDAIAGQKTPASYRAVLVRKGEQDMFEGLPAQDEDPRQSMHVEEVPTPALGPGEALVAVMASAVNCNTVWTSIVEPVSTFGFLARYGKLHDLAKRHDLPHHVVGSDLAGVVVAVGSAPHVGGGGLPGAEQVRRLPAAGLPQRGGQGAGRRRPHLGGFRWAGVLWEDPDTQDPREWQRLGAEIRELTGGDDADIVFEHPGRETLGASVHVAEQCGTIVTCASTSGFLHTYDNRHLWMNLERIVGSHFANHREAWEANRLIDRGLIHPTLSGTYPVDDVGQAAYDVHRNLHQGKVGVLTLAPTEGLGVTDPAEREQHLQAIDRFLHV